MAEQTVYSSVPTTEGGRVSSLIYRDEPSLPPPPFTRSHQRRRTKCVTGVTVAVLLVSAFGLAMTIALALDPSLVSRLINPGNQPSANQPSGNQPPASQFAGNQPAGNQPAGNQPSSNPDTDFEKYIIRPTQYPEKISTPSYTTTDTTSTTTSTTTTTIPTTTTTTISTTTTPEPTTTSTATTPSTTTTLPPETTTDLTTSSSDFINNVQENLEEEDEEDERQEEKHPSGYLQIAEEQVPLSLLLTILLAGILATLILLSVIIWAIKKKTKAKRRQQHVRNVIHDLTDNDKSNLLQSDEEVDA